MKKTIKTLLFIIALLVVFSAGVFTAIHQQWLQPLVTLDIINESQQDIERLEIKYKSWTIEGNVAVSPPKKRGTVTTRFYARGEGSYQIIVKLQNGYVIHYSDDYVEPGYKVKIIITPENINRELIGIF